MDVNQTMKRNLIINGSGIFGGGSYRDVKVRGDGTIDGHLDCERFKCFGSADLSGDLKAGSVTVFGTCSVKGSADAKLLKVFGTAEIAGRAKSRKCKISGAVEIGGGFTGEEVEVSGSLSVRGDVEAETLRVKGIVQIKGMLNAGTLDIYPGHSSSEIREIGGETIRVKKSKIGALLHLFKPLETLTAETIEGNDIELENTIAQTVRGHNVTIGQGCEIELVEYKEKLHIAKGARVQEQRKI
jgi:cytoskeletal protein CcmA (bactofilin family)